MAPTHPPGVRRTSWTRAARRKDASKRTAAFRRGRNRRLVVPRNNLGFATSQTATLRYTQRFPVNPSSILTLATTFSANDIFDPDVTGVGHQPRGAKEYAVIYDNFTVTSSRITVNWMYEGYDAPTLTDAGTGALKQTTDDVGLTPAQSPAIVGIMKSSAAYGASINNNEQMEQDKTTWTVINPQSGTRNTSAFSNFSEFFGKSNMIAAAGFSGETGGNLVGSSPANKVYYHVWASRGSTDYPSGSCKLTGYVTIEYRVTFTNPKKLTAS